MVATQLAVATEGGLGAYTRYRGRGLTRRVVSTPPGVRSVANVHGTQNARTEHTLTELWPYCDFLSGPSLQATNQSYISCSRRVSLSPIVRPYYKTSDLGHAHLSYTTHRSREQCLVISAEGRCAEKRSR